MEGVEQIFACDLRITLPSGKSVILQNVFASVNETASTPLLGMNVLKYFSALIKEGKLMLFEFNPAAIGR